MIGETVHVYSLLVKVGADVQTPTRSTSVRAIGTDVGAHTNIGSAWGTCIRGKRHCSLAYKGHWEATGSWLAFAVFVRGCKQ